MSHGENAEARGHCGKEYWSRRSPDHYGWGRYEGKLDTYRRERRVARKEVRELKEESNDRPNHRNR